MLYHLEHELVAHHLAPHTKRDGSISPRFIQIWLDFMEISDKLNDGQKILITNRAFELGKSN